MIEKEERSIIMENGSEEQGGRLVVKTILQEIEVKRQMMIKSGLENGLQSQKTINLSRQVDQLMNAFDEKQYDKMMINQPIIKNFFQ